MGCEDVLKCIALCRYDIGIVFLLFDLVDLLFGLVDLARTIVTPALVTLPLILEPLGVNCRDLRTAPTEAPAAVLTLTKFMPGRIINERNVII